jgi:hypothetical protein
MKRTTLLALLLASGAAQAAEWVRVAKSNNGAVEAFVDRSSILVLGDIRHAWYKTVCSPHACNIGSAGEEKWVSYSMTRYAYNCSEGTAKVEGMVSYFEDGTNWSIPNEQLAQQSWEPVPPDAMNSSAMNIVCFVWKPK